MKSFSKFPQSFDEDEDLYFVKDGLKTPLGLDYYPGNTYIVSETDISQWPRSGIITLVEQQSMPSERAVSFYYNNRTNREFLDIELLENSPDSFKPKKITYITMQVMAEHREALKNSIIAIEKFLGTKHEVDDIDGFTVFSRLNFLKKILFSPKAWFEATNLTGAVPLKVGFNFAGTGNVGPVGEVMYIWQFNDEEIHTTNPQIEKTFISPGKITVSLTVKNYYGQDTVTFVDMIHVKSQAPKQIPITFTPSQNQVCINDIIKPKIRTSINEPVSIEIAESKSTARELTVSNNDSISNYTWGLNDDLPHSNSKKTKALYANMGGLYDLTVRADTELGAYRITTYENAIDVVENINLWIWSKDANNNIRSFEFGLISEVFKTSSNQNQIYANDSFLRDDRTKMEFWLNNGAAYLNEFTSGQGGEATIFWASGRSINDPANKEEINFLSYNGFTDSYKSKDSISRPWNWVSLVSDKSIYFILGVNEDTLPSLSMTNQVKTTYDLFASNCLNDYLDYRNYKNGAQELLHNPGVLDKNYKDIHERYSICRSTWKDQTGYILRNSDLGEYLSLSNFYKTEGTIGTPFQNIVKLLDMPGDDSKNGNLASLNNGIYFFNNFGSSYCFNDSALTWELVPPHNRMNKELDSFLVVADKDSKAYISIGDSEFFKFNEIDMTYITLNKPTNEQWLMTIF